MKKVRFSTIAVIAITGLAVLALAGCGSTTGTAGGRITATDDAGKTISLDAPAERIVSLAPGNTEIVYAIGAYKKLVGVTSYCDYPAAAKKKPKIGDFSTPNIEKIASQNPQIVFATSGIQDSTVQSLEKLGIKVFVIDPRDFEGLFKDMESAGALTGMGDTAAKKVVSMRKKVDEIQAKAKGLPKTNVFFEIYKQPLMTAGKGTLIDQMIAMAGGINVGAKAGPDFPQYSEEQLLKDDPDVYVAVKGSQTDPADISKRTGYGSLKAVKGNKVFVVEDNPFVRSGPRLVEGLEQLARILHPDRFKSNQ
jgi:iron complex transport system substrate-binding protein